jgi:hypothetical protein
MVNLHLLPTSDLFSSVFVFCLCRKIEWTIDSNSTSTIFDEVATNAADEQRIVNNLMMEMKLIYVTTGIEHGEEKK